MKEDKKIEFVRTTVWIPRSLYESAKFMAILTQTTMSMLMRVALGKEIKELREKGAVAKDKL